MDSKSLRKQICSVISENESSKTNKKRLGSVDSSEFKINNSSKQQENNMSERNGEKTFSTKYNLTAKRWTTLLQFGIEAEN